MIIHAEQPWSSGMMLACHAGDPGSIPGGCRFSPGRMQSSMATRCMLTRQANTWASSYRGCSNFPHKRRRSSNLTVHEAEARLHGLNVGYRYMTFLASDTHARIPGGCSSAAGHSHSLTPSFELAVLVDVLDTIREAGLLAPALLHADYQAGNFAIGVLLLLG